MTDAVLMQPVFALGFIERARGLLGTNASWGDSGRVLVIAPCKSVHTIGMRYSLDIAFANKQGIVLRAERDVKPGRLLSCRHATLVLERPHRDEAWVEVGGGMKFSRDSINEQLR